MVENLLFCKIFLPGFVKNSNLHFCVVPIKRLLVSMRCSPAVVSIQSQRVYLFSLT